VIGSREVDRKWVKTSLKRRLIGRGFHLLTNWLTPGIRDTQCGFKLFRRPVALDLFSACQINGFAFDLEVLYLARLRGYSVRELPVKWVADPDSRVDLARDPWRMLWDCLSVPLIHHQKIKLPA
jgi:dolichyl-phosphate beta-glucosyltransferase